MPEDEGGRIQQAYGPNYRRLAEIKRRYDPKNRLRMNQNIQPSKSSGESRTMAQASAGAGR